VEIFFSPAPSEHVKREKAKAKELRASQWWRQQIGPGLCHYCGGKFPSQELTMDHLFPVIRGGKSTKKNCVPCCKPCNNRKGHRLAADFLADDSQGQTPSGL